VRLRIGADGRVLAVCVVGPVRPRLTRWFVRDYKERQCFPATMSGSPTPVTIEFVAEVTRAPSLDEVLRRRLAPEEAARFRWTPLLIATYASVVFDHRGSARDARGQNVYLRKMRGRWYVVAQENTWIS